MKPTSHPCVLCGRRTLQRNTEGAACHCGGCPNERRSPRPCAWCSQPTLGRDPEGKPACPEGKGCTVRHYLGERIGRVRVIPGMTPEGLKALRAALFGDRPAVPAVDSRGRGFCKLSSCGSPAEVHGYCVVCWEAGGFRAERAGDG